MPIWRIDTAHLSPTQPWTTYHPLYSSPIIPIGYYTYNTHKAPPYKSIGQSIQLGTKDGTKDIPKQLPNTPLLAKLLRSSGSSHLNHHYISDSTFINESDDKVRREKKKEEEWRRQRRRRRQREKRETE
jgi:hypothetical protein